MNNKILKKKLLAIAGSPRKGGNTDLLLEEVIRASHQAGVDTLLLRVSELKLSPCTACGICWESGECVQQDDMQTVYTHLLDSRYIVIASPLYFMGVSAQLKALIDRCQALWARRYILKRELRSGPFGGDAPAVSKNPLPLDGGGKVENPPQAEWGGSPSPSPPPTRGGGLEGDGPATRPRGLFISTAALNKGDKIFAGSIQTVKALFHVLGVEYKGEILCYGLEEKGAIQEHPELLEKVHQATLQLFEPLAQPALTRPP